MTVTSGDQVYYESSACEGFDPGSGTLLLSRDYAWKGALTWNGRRHEGCAPLDSDGNGETDAASAGVYQILIALNKEAVAEKLVLELR